KKTLREKLELRDDAWISHGRSVRNLVQPIGIDSMDRSRFGDLAIPQSAEDFQDFAPGREGTAVGALIEVHRSHELDFVVRVIALAGGGIDLPAAFPLAAIFAAPPFEGGGNVLLA